MGLPVLLVLTSLFCLRPRELAAAVSRPALAALLVIALIAWAAASSFWSPYHGHDQALKLIALIPMGMVVVWAAQTETPQSWVPPLTVAAFFSLAALLAIEGLADMPLNRAANPDRQEDLEIARNVNRGAIVSLALTWPALAYAAATSRPRLGLLIAGISIALTFPFGMAAHMAACLGGLLVYVLARALPGAVLLIVSSGLAAWTLLAPFATRLLIANTSLLDTLPYSWAARLGIWGYICDEIAERPWIGHGLDASRSVVDQLTIHGDTMRAVPLHPHSASLQIWYETGAVGALLAAAALLAGGWALSKALRNNRPAAAAAAAALASLGLVANLSFGIWQEWWIATMLVAAASISALSTAPR